MNKFFQSIKRVSKGSLHKNKDNNNYDIQQNIQIIIQNTKFTSYSQQNCIIFSPTHDMIINA